MNVKLFGVIYRSLLLSLVFCGLFLLCIFIQPSPNPLIDAVTAGNVERTSHLLTKFPQLVNTAFMGRTALHFAAGRRNMDLVRLLLKAGANPLARDACGNSPLHAAVFGFGNLNVRLLLEITQKPSLTNYWGDTPLHLAAYIARNPFAPEHTSMLLNAGASRWVTDSAGYTPLQLANLMRNTFVIHLLKEP